jgi:hypothetical protein
MASYPQVIVSSVIRSAKQDESHGGLYIVDLATDDFRQVIDWNECNIRWEGRGLDRGLRGVAFYNDRVYLAASDEIFVYDKNFELLESYKNRYLKHCHEIFISGNRLFVTSTEFDSVLEFDLLGKRFESDKGPSLGDTLHINVVSFLEGTMYVSGTSVDSLICVKEDRLSLYARIPLGSHNACPFGEGALLNDTERNCVVYMDRKGNVIESFNIIHYNESKLLRADLPKDHARQAFGRGLCVHDDMVIGGSSPATVSVYKFGRKEALKTVNITMDIRNSIHGLEVWPY